MKVINLWGSPGAGKSTVAAGLFYRMKCAGYSVELVTEYAKDVTWEERTELFKDQLYLLAHQNRRLERLRGKVEYCITDSPLLLTVAYTPKGYYSTFNDFTHELWSSYDNENYLIKRSHAFEQTGRWHTEEQTQAIDRIIEEIFIQYPNLDNVKVYTDTIRAVDGIFEKVQRRKYGYT